MRVEFTRKREDSPETLIVEAEVIFDAECELFCGMKLTGFSVWKGKYGGEFVNLPSRAFGTGKDRAYFSYLRPADDETSEAGKAAIERLKRWIKDEYHAWVAAQGSRTSPRRPPEDEEADPF